MKVECIAIVKDYASADVRAQRVAVDAFTRLGVETEQFHVLEDAKLFFKEMGEMFSRADVIVAAADEDSFLEQKWNMLKVLGLKSEICPAVVSVVREEVSAPDTTMKAHALMPKDAAVFLTSDGLYSGFAMRSGKQTLLFLPLSEWRMREIVENGLEPYFADRLAAEQMQQSAQAVSGIGDAPVFDVPDNTTRFAETAKLLNERDLTVAFAATETNVYIQNGVRANPHFGESFIPAAAHDDPGSRESVTERVACLADAARQEIGTTLGAAISNIYSLGMDAKELFLHVALSDGVNANVRKITAPEGMTPGELVALATDTLYSMLQDYAYGDAFPPEEAEVKPIKLYTESVQSAKANAARKRSTAIRIAVCVVIALVLCVLIGFYFKDQVAALFDSSVKTQAAVVEMVTEPQTWVVPEETTTEPQTQQYAAEDVDMALFGTSDEPQTAEPQTMAFVETPAPQEVELDVQPYVAPETTSKSTTKPAETTTKAQTTEAKTTSAQAPVKAAAENETEKVVEEKGKPLTTVEATTSAREEASEKAELTKAETTSAAATTTTEAVSTTRSLFAGLGLQDEQNATFTFTVYGYGHGVGMSQLGALAYARRGWSYSSILTHYYPGTALTRESAPETVTYCGTTRDLEDFMIRAVQQEIGGYCKSGDEEALKAQAVAIYSYMKVRGYKLTSNDMACSTLADSKLSDLVRSAVRSVIGEYLTYGGKPILAQFYASSAGKTTSASNVWGGNSYPYLSGGVESIEEVSKTTCTVSAADFKAMIEAYNRANPEKKITLSGSPSEWIEILSHDGARGNVGYVSGIRVGDKTMSGNTFRTIFNAYRKSGTAGMRSHCFSFTVG